MCFSAINVFLFKQKTSYVCRISDWSSDVCSSYLPTKIRYTSMSLPYHIGNGIFGGLTPFIAASVVAATGNIYAGLIYPIAVAAISFIIGMVYLKETRHNRIHEDRKSTRLNSSH